jgi:undecaprenyl diphosphate synthase
MQSARGLHVAIIMDGNGRWATQRNLPRTLGHRAGVLAARRIIEHAPEVGVARLTLYAFSSDNWRRPHEEIEKIFWLLRAFLRLERQRMRERGVRLEIIGRRDRLAPEVLRAIERAERETATGTRLSLRIAVDYSSRDAISRTIANTAAHASADVLRAALTKALSSGLGDVDLLIRTGGEKRLSDFLLWESAYAELYFTARMWPDFAPADLEAALADFRSRDRRFGGLTPTSNASVLDFAPEKIAGAL